jgi:hypothetical protein
LFLLGIEGVGGEREGAEWVLREGVGAGRGEMTQALYAHMNNKGKKRLAHISS